jgi:hypothetical protein
VRAVRALFFSLLGTLVAVTGCGPVQYFSQVTQNAASEVAAAKTAGADRLAPYEYTTAVLYLHKAREEAGYSDYQAAIRFGKKAELMAKKARRMAGQTDEPSSSDGEEAGDNPIDPSATPSEDTP